MGFRQPRHHHWETCDLGGGELKQTIRNQTFKPLESMKKVKFVARKKMQLTCRLTFDICPPFLLWRYFGLYNRNNTRLTGGSDLKKNDPNETSEGLKTRNQKTTQLANFWVRTLDPMRIMRRSFFGGRDMDVHVSILTTPNAGVQLIGNGGGALRGLRAEHSGTDRVRNRAFLKTTHLQ